MPAANDDAGPVTLFVPLSSVALQSVPQLIWKVRIGAAIEIIERVRVVDIGLHEVVRLLEQICRFVVAGDTDQHLVLGASAGDGQCREAEAVVDGHKHACAEAASLVLDWRWRRWPC